MFLKQRWVQLLAFAGGRIIQGTGNDPNHYVPVNARCTVGTLVPQTAQ